MSAGGKDFRICFGLKKPGQNSRRYPPRDEAIVPGNHNDIEKRLWGAADELRANSKMKASEYSLSVLGLIYLKYADFKFRQAEQELKGKGIERSPIGKLYCQAQGVLYLHENARFSNLIELPEGIKCI